MKLHFGYPMVCTKTCHVHFFESTDIGVSPFSAAPWWSLAVKNISFGIQRGDTRKQAKVVYLWRFCWLQMGRKYGILHDYRSFNHSLWRRAQCFSKSKNHLWNKSPIKCKNTILFVTFDKVRSRIYFVRTEKCFQFTGCVINDIPFFKCLL